MITHVDAPAILAPFFRASQDVLESELGLAVKLGPAGQVVDDEGATVDMTVLVAVTGDLEGTAMYQFSESCALGILSHLMGSPLDEMSELAESGIAELGNVITGRAAVLLSEQGSVCDIAPPVVIRGQRIHVRAPHLPEWRARVKTPYGPIDIRIAVRPIKTNVRSTFD